MKEMALNSAEPLNISALENLTKDEASKISSGIMADDYILYLCNRSNWVVTSITNRQGVVTPINPPIGKTCDLSVDECIKQQKYVPLVVTQCTEASFGITMHLVHKNGFKADSPLINISPDCKFAGQSVTLSLPDPV